MPDSWCDHHVRPLIAELKTVEERQAAVETALGELEARVAKIKAESRIKDRQLWLVVWANGDRAIYDEYRTLRNQLKLRRQQIARFPGSHLEARHKLDRAIADRLEQTDPAYRRIVAEERESRSKRDTCRDASTLIAAARADITNLAASLTVEPTGKAVAAKKTRKPDDYAAQVKVVREKLGQVRGMAGSRGVMDSGLVKSLERVSLDAGGGPDKRMKQLDQAAGTLNRIGREVDAKRRKAERRLGELERDRARAVAAERWRLLTVHGLTAT
jgi:hypothetical protein